MKKQIDNCTIENTIYYEMQLILFGLIVLGSSVVFFYLTDLVPVKIENTEMSIIIISLGIGLLILLADKRQSQDKKRSQDTTQIY